MKIALCILTLNEIECVGQIVPMLQSLSNKEQAFDFIYVIDGGSTDGTLEYFQSLNIPILGQSKKGRGEAFQIAFEKIQCDAFIFFSPDGNEDVQDLFKFRPLIEAGHDLIIASRMMKGSFNEEDVHFFKPRKWANNIFNLAANILFRKNGVYVSDSINGYRAITKSASKELELDAPDYTIEYQMTIRAMVKKMSIVEFPTYEGQRVGGSSQAKSIPTGIKFIRCLWKETKRKFFTQ